MKLSSRRVLFVSLLLCLVVTGVAGVSVAESSVSTTEAVMTTEAADRVATADHTDHVYECAATPPDDFADPDGGSADTIGWVDGYWYNQPLDVGPELSEDDLESVTARTAARYEALRCLTFEEVPPVETLDRETFANNIVDDFATVTDEERQAANARLATQLLVGHDEDAVDVLEAQQVGFPAAYYHIEDEEIVFITDGDDASDDSITIDESTLAHELGHALQGQQFGLDHYDRSTGDRDRAKLGVIEGDVTYVQSLYRDNCDADRWVGDCLNPDPGNPQEPANWGLYLQSIQPYMDGPDFVEQTYTDGGWDAVDALYDDMPQTALHTISPETFGDVEPVSLEVPDDSTAEWDRISPQDGGTDVVGQAGLSAMAMVPSIETGYETNIVDRMRIATPDGQINYDYPETDGWRGDHLITYHNDESDTASVWELAWRDSDEAGAFADAYTHLLEYNSAEPVPNADGGDIYTFGDDSAYDMSVALDSDGDRLRIVTAPTTAELADVHSTLDVDVAATGDGNDGFDDGSDVDSDEGSTGDDDADDESDTEADDESADDVNGDVSDDADDGSTGFGILVALGTLLVGTVLIRRRRH